MKNPISEVKARIAENNRREHMAYLDGLYAVKERDGSLWITCGGTAVKRFPSSASAQDVTAEIENMRGCAKSYYLAK